MSDSVDRVIVWGTGYVGKRVIAEIVDHPHFELAGVIVSDPGKDGRDVGDICGIDPLGITATTDVDAALAIDADAVAYYGPTAEQARENIENMAKALRAGKDVVSTAMTNFVWWQTADRWMLEPMEQACIDGGTSCFTSGIDPGFANDLLPMTLMGVCGRVDKVTASEILDYATYTGDYEPMGYGKPAEFRALLEIPEILIMAWGGTVPMMAAAMEVELDEITTTYDKWVTPERIEFAERGPRTRHGRGGALHHQRHAERRGAHRARTRQSHHERRRARVAAGSHRGERRVPGRHRGQPDDPSGDHPARRRG